METNILFATIIFGILCIIHRMMKD